MYAAAGESFAFAPGERAPGGVVPFDAQTAPRPAPLVELPLGTTLDRLVGSLDLGRALAGEQAFEAGLLARAHRGILYVDEVNLLPDHLVDALLDAAATGVARVEREAVSVVHAARFLLVGTMNVEEGELRPQLLDRFGLGVEVKAPPEPRRRTEIVRRRLPSSTTRRPSRAATRTTSASLRPASRRRGSASTAAHAGARAAAISNACVTLGIDGMRGDIVTTQAARALAALDGADEISEDHVRRAAALALVHRRRRDPLDGHIPDSADVERALDLGGETPDDEPPRGGSGPRGGPLRGADGGAPGAPGSSQPAGAQAQAESPDRNDQGDAGAAAAATDTASDEPPNPNLLARERRDPPAPAHLPDRALALAATGEGPPGRRARTRGPGAGAIDSRPARPGSTTSRSSPPCARG